MLIRISCYLQQLSHKKTYGTFLCEANIYVRVYEDETELCGMWRMYVYLTLLSRVHVNNSWIMTKVIC